MNLKLLANDLLGLMEKPYSALKNHDSHGMWILLNYGN